MKEDFSFDKFAVEAAELLLPNDRLSCKVAEYKQRLCRCALENSMDDKEFLRDEILTFAALMDTELIVPVRKTGTMAEKNIDAPVYDWISNVPLIPFDTGKGQISLFPIFTDSVSLFSEGSTFDDCDIFFADIQDLFKYLKEHCK